MSTIGTFSMDLLQNRSLADGIGGASSRAEVSEREEQEVRTAQTSTRDGAEMQYTRPAT